MRATSEKFEFDQAIVIGANGQVGRRLTELLCAHQNTTLVSDRIELDCDAESLAQALTKLGAGLDPKGTTALLMCAAYTNVEGCQADPSRCNRINVDNTIAVLKWARQRFGARVVFYSSDYVFDGKAGPYAETAATAPLCEYGRAKLAVEQWLAKNDPDALVIRTTGVYDYLPDSKNFLMQMLSLWQSGQRARVPCDQRANPVWAAELARATLQLLQKKTSGVFHVAGGTQLARSDFARAIARAFGYAETLIKDVTTHELGQKAPRPLLGGLKCERLKAELGWAPKPAEEILESLSWLHKK